MNPMVDAKVPGYQMDAPGSPAGGGTPVSPPINEVVVETAAPAGPGTYDPGLPFDPMAAQAGGVVLPTDPFLTDGEGEVVEEDTGNRSMLIGGGILVAAALAAAAFFAGKKGRKP